MKKISVYVKGDRNSTAYYRIYQYLDKVAGVFCSYHLMMSPVVHRKYMPVSKQKKNVKIWIYVHIYFRMLLALIRDYCCLPDVLVIHRRIISRYMPFSFRLLLIGILKRGVPLIWDFDDHIINNGEVSCSTFNLYARYATRIIVTHDYLKELIPIEYRNKVCILPTTDGDMYKLFQSKDINSRRIEEMKAGYVNLVWVATSVNLKYLEGIIEDLDQIAYLLKRTKSKRLCLKVICNEPLVSECKWLVVENIKWTREAAIKGMEESHIGIMPLEDTTFTRGKGGFKLVQYLSIGLPCIASDVGFNVNVVSSNCGFLVDTKHPERWGDAILQLCEIETWKKFSEGAFKQWLFNFSYEKNLAFWSGLLN